MQKIIVESAQEQLNTGKINIPDKDLPLSTAVISSKVIADKQAIRLGDIVKNVPGVSLVQTRYGVNETYEARSYIIGITGSAGGGRVFKKGLSCDIPGMPEAVSFKSVEIIKGSSAFLSGSLFGGLIINMISKILKYNFGGNISWLMGSNLQFKPIVNVYGLSIKTFHAAL